MEFGKKLSKYVTVHSFCVDSLTRMEGIPENFRPKNSSPEGVMTVYCDSKVVVMTFLWNLQMSCLCI